MCPVQLRCAVGDASCCAVLRYPQQTKMIDAELMTTEEVKWLDTYHQRVRLLIG